MGKLSRLAGLLACSASLVATSLAANAGVMMMTGQQFHGQPLTSVKYIGNGWWNDNGVVYHTPHYMKTRQQSLRARQNTGALSYHGGPVLTIPKVYVVAWGFRAAGDPNKVGKLLKHYLTALGGSGIANVATQYYQGSGASQTFITNPTGQLGGIWHDNSAIPTHPTDGQVAAEAGKLEAHFGFDANASYVVATAHNHSIQGFGTSFCAYHGASVQGGNHISYTNLPYQPDAGGNCGANIISPPSDETGADEGVTIVEGHEYTESITDPQLSAWWDSANGEEIGDLCAWQNIQNDPMAGGSSYTQQPEYSNASSSCVHTYP